MKNAAGLFLKGVAMGAANVIPGVSGGTIAFISGIYERLIKALKSFDLSLLSLLMQGQFRQVSEKTDLKFLSILFSGIAVSIFSLAHLLEYVLQFYEVFTLAFFFGLIVASTLGVGRQISKFSLGVLITFLIGFVMAISIAFLTPAAANDHWLYVILCGMVAISSMILPGLSGSYILLLMGNYVLMLQSISQFHFKFLIPFALGCLLGLVIFSRLLSYLFDHFKEATISLLTGFVAIQELDYSKLWLLEEGHCLRTQVQNICELSDKSQEKHVNIEFKAGSLDSLLRFTKASKGVTILPYLASLALSKSDQKKLIPFKFPTPVRSIGLVTHKHFVKKQLLNQLQAIIQQVILPLIPKNHSTKQFNPLS